MNIQELQEQLSASEYSEHIERMELNANEATVWGSTQHIDKFLKFLKEQYKLNMLIDICAADYPGRELRFEVIYHLLSVSHNMRLRVKVAADENILVPTITEVFKNAMWYEREVWDMYGIYFANNTDLRRLLTDYGFVGHPMRKDFPLTGYVETRYDLRTKKVAYEPVQLVQEYRNFDFASPWEGTEYVLPGDEKAE